MSLHYTVSCSMEDRYVHRQTKVSEATAHRCCCNYQLTWGKFPTALLQPYILFATP